MAFPNDEEFEMIDDADEERELWRQDREQLRDMIANNDTYVIAMLLAGKMKSKGVSPGVVAEVAAVSIEAADRTLARLSRIGMLRCLRLSDYCISPLGVCLLERMMASISSAKERVGEAGIGGRIQKCLGDGDIIRS